MQTFLFILLYATKVRTEIDRRDNGFGNEFNGKNQGRMYSHTVLMYLEEIIFEECIHYCISHLRCRTVSYSSAAKLCELNDKDFDEREADTDATGWTNYGTLAKVNGGFTDWKNATDCSQSCGGGYKEYFRTCDDPAPKHGGDYCYGDEVKTETCNTHKCPPNKMFQYQCSTERKTWFDAEKYCISWGGHLTSIKNNNEMNDIVDQCQRKGLSGLVWIGLNNHKAGTWQWTDGSDLSLNLWRRGFPLRDRTCGSIDFGLQGFINSFRCHMPTKFICKK